MTHEEAQGALSRRLDRSLPKDEQAGLQSHLDSCPECRSFADELNASLGALQKAAGAPAMPAAMRGRILRRFGELNPPRAFPWIPAFLLVSAAAVLLFGTRALLRPKPGPVLPPAASGGARPAPAYSDPIPFPSGSELESERSLRAGSARRGAAHGPSKETVEEFMRVETAVRLAGLPRAKLRSPSVQGPISLEESLHERKLDLWNDPEMLPILRRRAKRSDRIDDLKVAGFIGEDSAGSLAVREAAKLAGSDRDMLAEENKDRALLIGAYEKLRDAGMKDASPLDGGAASLREAFIESQRQLDDPGFWQMSPDGSWRQRAP